MHKSRHPAPSGDLYDIIDMYEAEEAATRGEGTMPRSSRVGPKRFDAMNPGELAQVRMQGGLACMRACALPGARIEKCPGQRQRRIPFVYRPYTEAWVRFAGFATGVARLLWSCRMGRYGGCLGGAVFWRCWQRFFWHCR
jgi:hypothetical protein